MQQYTITITTEEQMHAFASHLAKGLAKGSLVFLQGHLGAGKTTLVRSCIQVLGYEGKVKSPTYTLVEPYQVANQTLYHFDLYRLGRAIDLYDIGIEEYLGHDAICFIEWAEKGLPVLPVPDLICAIEVLDPERRITLLAKTPRGEQLVTLLNSG